ncbi:MAG: YdeI/OmpD-associated family protein [Sporocytophaga sp.]|uniref:YdeI/OmpD-associated family protein n=1 Tax=Sporocytophaga sp. TaxID=2231183 RepID=UPI001B2C4B79|nr:YdeI/OmpD-associated family protein [Sporocytophaga sp.]MBO9700759.1 YdeI/OmpD-associated family protein [Sporocytophaga sp.]
MEINAITKKLGIKNDFKVLVINQPDNLKDLLLPLPENAEQIKKAGKQTADAVLLFASNISDLNKHFENLKNAVKPNGLVWIAYPKGTSKIKTDISRDKGWEVVNKAGLTGVSLISLDDMWSAMRFKPLEEIKNKAKRANAEEDQYIDLVKRVVTVPDDLKKLLNKNKAAKATFENLSFTHKKEFVLWIISAKKEETRTKRLEQALEKLLKTSFQ